VFVLKVNFIANRSMKDSVWHGRRMKGARIHVRTDLQNESFRKKYKVLSLGSYFQNIA
jgi:hypothetical protein